MPTATSRTALVVEDLPDTRKWLVEQLSAAYPDLKITAVGDLSTALAFLRSTGSLGIPLVDLGLPDGRE